MSSKPSGGGLRLRAERIGGMVATLDLRVRQVCKMCSSQYMCPFLGMQASVGVECGANSTELVN
jgi:hypothetical protein